MLLKTIKSRNIWLWSETVFPGVYVDYARKIDTELITSKETLGKLQNSQIIQNDVAWRSTPSSDFGSSSAINAAEQAATNEYIGRLENERNIMPTTEPQTVIKTEYTTPFYLKGVQDVDTTWDHVVGESAGLTANYLQAWHHKPITVRLSGLSYFGAYDGVVVDMAATLAQIRESENAISSSTSAVADITQSISAASSFVAKGVSAVSQGVNTARDFLNKVSNTIESESYDNVLDQDIERVKELMSAYGEGPAISNKTKGSSWINMLIENEPGAQATNSSGGEKGYVVFTGFIKRFTYKESVDKPFVYQYNLEFIGVPTNIDQIRNATIVAKKDTDTLKITMLNTQSGLGIGYGF